MSRPMELVGFEKIAEGIIEIRYKVPKEVQ